MRINVWKNGVIVGYVKSVNPSRNTFSITQDVMKAKSYKSLAILMGDIDFCTMCKPGEYVYTYQ